MRSTFTPHIGIVARAQVILLAGAVSLWSVPALAQATSERPSDKDVKALFDQIEEGRDKFEGNLEGQFKDAIIRDATREVKVSAGLQDYQDNIKKLKERFTDDYSASAEVTVVLTQAGNFQRFMQTNPSCEERPQRVGTPRRGSPPPGSRLWRVVPPAGVGATFDE